MRPTVARLFIMPALILSLLAHHPLLGQDATAGPDDEARDWAMTAANPGRTGATSGPGLPTAPVEGWRVPVELDQRTAPLGPLVADGTMFVWGWTGQGLHAIDIATGVERWQADIGKASPPMLGSWNAVVGDGMLYVIGTADEVVSTYAGGPRVLFALDATSGRERWRVSFEANHYIDGMLLTGGLLVFSGVGPRDGHAVVALDPASGQEKWRAALPPSLALLSAPAATSETLYVAAAVGGVTKSGVLYAFETVTGRERWHVSTPGAPRFAPIVTNDSVTLASSTDEASAGEPVQYAVQAFAADTGAELWKVASKDVIDGEPFNLYRIAAAHGLIYVDVGHYVESSTGTIPTNTIVALDAASGAVEWQAASLVGPVVAGNVLYASSATNLLQPPNPQPYFLALNAITGEELWRIPGDVRILIAGSSLLIVENHKALIAYGSH